MTDSDKFEHDIFLSYSQTDEEWAARLYTRLTQEFFQGRKLKVFFAPKSNRPGRSFIKEFQKALTTSRKFGLIMSREAIESGWVESELLAATLIAINNKEDRIIPIYLRDCEIPPLLSHIVHVDFREEYKFAESFRVLLAVIRDEPIPDDLQPEDKSTGPSLPPIPRPPKVGFVPRRTKEGEDLVKKIEDLLAPELNRLVVLCGNGGFGKTTLAVEAVNRLRAKFKDRISWVSADGRKDFGINTLLDDIASQMQRANLRELALEPKKEAVRALLAAEPSLIVLDNFETISNAEQENCRLWLEQSALCPALITTRESLARTTNIRIDGMLPEEAGEYTNRLIEQANNPYAFDGLDLNRIIEVAEANPLIIEWIVGQIDAAQDYHKVLEDLSKGKGEAAQRVFDRSFDLEQLTDDGRDTLLALSLFAPSASRKALADVAGFGNDEDRVNEAVKRLALLRLLTPMPGGHRLAVKGLTREFAKARLERMGRDDEFRRRFIDHFLRFCEKYSETSPENHNALEAEKDNLVAAIETAFNLQDWKKVMRLVDIVASRSQNMMDVRGYWNEGVICIEQSLKAARQLQSENAIANYAHNLGIIYQNRGELEEARKLYNESLEIKKKLGNQRGIASTLHQLAVLAQNQGEIDEACKLYNESLEINEKLGNLSPIALTLYELGRLAQNQGKIDEARKFCNESLEINKKLGSLSGIALTLQGLATLELTRGKIEEARKLYNESLQISKKLGDQNLIAFSLLNLGVLAENEKNKEEAARLYYDALSIFEKLGSHYADLARKYLKEATG